MLGGDNISALNDDTPNSLFQWIVDGVILTYFKYKHKITIDYGDYTVEFPWKYPPTLELVYDLIEENRE